MRTLRHAMMVLALTCLVSPVFAQAPAPTAKPKTPAAAPAAAATLIDLNSAPKDKLMTLPGIGDARAEDHRGGRTKRRPTSTKKIIPEATYKKIAGLVIPSRGSRRVRAYAPKSRPRNPARRS